MTARRVAVNDRGAVVGQDHWRAKLTDHEVDLVRALLAERAALISRLQRSGARLTLINRSLKTRRLSYAAIAKTFEVSKTHVRSIAADRVRAQVAYRTVVRHVKPANQERTSA